MVVIGGDGSYRGAQALSKQGINTIGLPGTIDLDIACTEYTIGFDTAVNTAMEMVDKLRDTAQSHDRCTVVEVMGRHAGYIALHTGIAVGAATILVPEIEYSFKKDIVDRILAMKKTGKKHFIIVVVYCLCRKRDFIFCYRINSFKNMSMTPTGATHRIRKNKNL